MANIEDVKRTTKLHEYIRQDLRTNPEIKGKHYWQFYCPLHADEDSPSLTVYTNSERGWYCYGCLAGGSIIDWVMEYQEVDYLEAMHILGVNIENLSKEELEQKAKEREERAKEYRQAAQAKRREAWREFNRLMQEANELDKWADQLLENARALRFLADKGISQAIAMEYELGYCNERFGLGDAITIPWMFNGKLRNVQYRFIEGKDNARYRWDPRAKGAKQLLYNADEVMNGNGDLILTEGAFKALVLIQHGFNAVALTNKGGWEHEWVPYFRKRNVYIALDPDAKKEAEEIAASIGRKAKVVDVPEKIDDLIVGYGWNREDVKKLLEQGWRV